MSMGWRNGWSCEVHQNASVGYVGLGSGCPLCKAENENMDLKLKLKQAEAELLVAKQKLENKTARHMHELNEVMDREEKLKAEVEKLKEMYVRAFRTGWDHETVREFNEWKAQQEAGE